MTCADWVTASLLVVLLLGATAPFDALAGVVPSEAVPTGATSVLASASAQQSTADVSPSALDVSASDADGACPNRTRDGRHTPKVHPEVSARRLEGEIVVDGRIEEAAWTQAQRVSGFTEILPGDRVAPQVCTEVRIGYDDDRLYFAFHAYEDDPSSIRASLRNRDAIFSDDWVGVVIDPYGDATQAYELFANPLGIQADLLLTSGRQEDIGFDVVYESAGRITEYGYQVEMAIPFSSLRFPSSPNHKWGFTVLRTRQRENRQQYSWASVDQQAPCFMCQMGTLTGIEDITPRTNLNVLPALVGGQSEELNDARAPGSGLASPTTRLEPSVNLRYAITSGVVAEATVNPDFSQVASDAARVDVNTTFALSYPERRPFFQEGIDLLESASNIVYTRSINAPLAAGKMTGRFGKTSVAYLTALDEQTPLLVPLEERSSLLEVGQSASNILRARRTLGNSSFLGVTLTDRRLLDAPGGGSLVSVDGAVNVLERYRLSGQVSLSDTREPSSQSLSQQVVNTESFGDGHTPALDGERFQGVGTRARLSRKSRHWDVQIDHFLRSPTYRAPTGFITRNDYQMLRVWQGYMFYFKDRFVERFQLRTYGYTERNLDGVTKETYGRLGIWSQFKGQTYVWGGGGLKRERFGGVMFERMPHWNLNASTNFTSAFRTGVTVEGGDAISRFDVERGNRTYVSGWADVEPSQHLTLSPEVVYYALRDPDTGNDFFRGYILRARADVQVTREWSFRLVTQYDHFDGSVSVEPLASYQINPFSVVYVGSTHGYNYVNGGSRSYITDRQFFFKLQYLFQI